MPRYPDDLPSILVIHLLVSVFNKENLCYTGNNGNQWQCICHVKLRAVCMNIEPLYHNSMYNS